MKWIATVIVLIIGIGAAFFGVLNVLFTDVLSAEDWVSAVAYIIILYLAAGFVSAVLWPGMVKRFRWLIWLPAFLAVLVISISEFQRTLIHLGILLLAIIMSWVGFWAGCRIRGIKKEENHDTDA